MVGRVIRIIEQLAVGTSSPTLADLARSTGLPKSSLHRLLAVLAVHGVVIRHGSTYRLGDRLVEWIPSRDTRSTSTLRRLLMPHLTDLYRRTGMIVGLAALALPDVIVIETIYGHQQLGVALRLPERAPAHRTAAGKLLLALRPGLLSDDQRSDWSTTGAPTDRTVPDQELAAIRATGIAAGRGEPVPGMTTIAVPVSGRDGQPVAALMVCGPDRPAELAQATKQLRHAAYAASLTVRGANSQPIVNSRPVATSAPVAKSRPVATNGPAAYSGPAEPATGGCVPATARALRCSIHEREIPDISV